MFRFLLAFCCLVLSCAGCVRTEITNQSLSEAGGPYRHFLVCSMAPEIKRAALLEEMIAARLKRHGVQVDRCFDTLEPFMVHHQYDEAAAQMVSKGFDAILILQPRDAYHTTRSSTTVPVPAAANLPQFLEKYAALRQGRPAPPPNPHSISGEADLLDVARNQVVWSSGGETEGFAKASLETLMKSISRRLESELEKDRLLPR